MTHQQKRHIKLKRAIHSAGYEILKEGKTYRLRSLDIGWMAGELIPYGFRSLQSAAEWLCPIVRDDDFTNSVRTG